MSTVKYVHIRRRQNESAFRESVCVMIGSPAQLFWFDSGLVLDWEMLTAGFVIIRGGAEPKFPNRPGFTVGIYTTHKSH